MSPAPYTDNQVLLDPRSLPWLLKGNMPLVTRLKKERA